MHRPAIALILVILAPPLLNAATYKGKGVGVTDGNTISVMKAGKFVNIRQEGVDCPEESN